MALPHSPYAGLTNPQMGFLDDTFAVLGQIGVIQCTASGTNLITLTPVTNMPNVAAYANLQKFSFTALNSSTGSVTLQVGSLAALPVYLADGTTQLGSGAIVAGKLYEVTFLSAINSGSGGFIVISASASGVTAGTYNSPSITVDASGRITSATGAVSARSYLAGYILSNDSGSPSRSIVVSAGQAADSANVTTITLTSGTAKTVGGAWVAGPSQSGLGTGVSLTSSTWYHVFPIINNGTPDVYLDTSITAANAPTNTTAFRRVGSVLTNNASTSGQISITAFKQTGEFFQWMTPVLDLSAQSPATANRTIYGLTVPTGLKLMAMFNARVDSGGASGQANVLFTDPDTTDSAPGDGTSTNVEAIGVNAAASNRGGAQVQMMTNASAQIGARSSQAAMTLGVSTFGWWDNRGRFN